MIILLLEIEYKCCIYVSFIGMVNVNNWVFGLSMAKYGVCCCYKHCFKLFSKMRRETEFRQYRCQNCKKEYEREESWVMWLGRKKMNFGSLPKFNPLPKLCPWSALVWVLEWFTNCDNQVAKIIGNWGERKYELWQSKLVLFNTTQMGCKFK